MRIFDHTHESKIFFGKSFVSQWAEHAIVFLRECSTEDNFFKLRADEKGYLCQRVGFDEKLI